MEKKSYKFMSEFAILMYLDAYQILQQSELEEFGKTQKTFTEHNPCNIYFVLKRPKLTIDPTYQVRGDSFIELKYFIHSKEEKHERLFRIKFPNIDLYKFDTEYPYNYFSLTTTNKTLLNRYYKLAVVIDTIHKNSIKEEPLLDYEVLYIGQAYGEDGNRTAIDRLASHSTLQKIYYEAMNKNPDSEIWLLLSSFTQRNLTSINGLIQMPDENKEEDLKRSINFNNPQNPISEKQKINFTEAALINTYLPKYNKEYKNTFPNPAHSSYNECYKLDVNSVIVELDTSDIRRWLYSESKPAKPEVLGTLYWHFGKFHFISDEDRYKIFNHDYL